MSPKGHVSLVGLSGTGKSTVAPLLAGSLGCDWVDLDSLVVQRSGVSIPELFEAHGEQGFRTHEVEALRSALDGAPCVLATGGGLVTRQEAADLLAERTTVVWLRADPGVLVERLDRHDESRPLMAGDPLESLLDMQARRGPIYEKLQDFTVDVGDLRPSDVAAEITRLLEEPG